MTDRSDPSAPRAVRRGEELDVDSLIAALAGTPAEISPSAVVEQFPGGHSNLTYLIRDSGREVVLRRPPKGAKDIKAGHDMGREFRILSGLYPIWPKVPRPLLFVDENASPIGVPFYVMERVQGTILRGPAAAALDGDTLGPASEALVETLVEIHGVDYRAAGLADLGHPEGYLQRQVDGWASRYEKSATDDFPEVATVVEWLRGHVPPDNPPTLIHNDFKYDNVVFDPKDLSAVRAVLDWEMSTIGDPLADLGCTLAYWIDPDDPPEVRALQLGAPAAKGNLTRRGVAERYAARSGRDTGDMLFYYVLALFKVAVIAQQIYARYKRGLTSDERFGAMIHAVRVLTRSGVRALDRGTV